MGSLERVREVAFKTAHQRRPDVVATPTGVLVYNLRRLYEAWEKVARIECEFCCEVLGL